MMMAINAELLSSLRPSIRERIKQSLTEAFELALLIKDKHILEETIDQLSDKYADKLSEPDPVEDADISQTVVLPPIDHSVKKKAGHGVNLVSGRDLQTPVSVSSRGFPGCTLTNKTGYKGVQHKSKNTWRARYGSMSETFFSAIEAAKAYDKAVFQRTGSIVGLNFPEDYKKRG